MLIDVDVHAAPDAVALEPYMETRHASEYFAALNPGGHVLARSGYRMDAYPPGGGGAGSDPAFMAEHLLDRYGIDVAILTPMCALGIGEVLDIDLASEVAHAANAWQVEKCLPVDERYRGSVVVATGDPARAAAEIALWADHPRMVQVYTTGLPCLMGDRFLHPIYQECHAQKKPFTLHVSGTSLTAVSKLNVSAPATYFESRTSMCLSAISQLVSAIADGVFVKYPDFRLVISEFGTAWLPWLMWRMDMEYRANREDVPWLTRFPSEYVADFVRFTTQPLEEPRDPRDLVTLMSLIGAERLLMFSSDYPHHDFDDPDLVRERIPEAWRDRVFFENANELYGLSAREAVTA